MKLNTTDIVLLIPRGESGDSSCSSPENSDLEVDWLDDDDLPEDQDEGSVSDDSDDDAEDTDGDSDEDEGKSSDEADDADEADSDSAEGSDEADESADDDSDSLEVEVEREPESDELTEGKLESADEADETNPEDIFGDDMKWECPDSTLDQNEHISSEIAEGAERTGTDPDYYLETRPYCPHPEAKAKDHIVVYDENDEGAQDALTTIRKKVGLISRTIGSQMRRVLASRSVATTVRDRRRGRIDRRKLHTLNRPGRQPNSRIFTEIQEGESNDTVVGLLIDQSGSMTGTKISCAREATVALGDALAGLASLGIKFGVWGFDSHYYGCVGSMPYTDRNEPLRFHHYKGTDENWNRVASRVGLMDAEENNCDGECVRWAGQQLLETKASRRVLIVLSDGQPSCQSSSSSIRIDADLKAAVKQLGQKNVEVLGIGICTSAVKDYYPNHTVINNAKDLEQTLMSALRELMLGTKRKVA